MAGFLKTTIITVIKILIKLALMECKTLVYHMITFILTAIP